MNTKQYYDMCNLPEVDFDLSDEQINFLEKHKLLVYVLAKSSLPQSKQLVMVNKLNYKRNQKDICEIANALNDRSIDYRVLKGIGICETYDLPFSRQMGDHDVLVKFDDFENAKDALEQIGYTKLDSLSTYKDISLFKKGSLMVELHHAVLNREREFFADAFLDLIWSSKYSVMINDVPVLTPDINIHFRYIMIHMMKHLKVSGFGVRHLLDLKHFQEKHCVVLEDHNAYFEEIGYGAFYKAVISLCYYKFHLKIKNSDWLLRDDDLLLLILENFIFEGGVFGTGSERLRINKVYRKYENQSGKSSHFYVALKSLFPSAASLNKKYKYAHKTPCLLPVAWLHRLFDNFTRSDIRWTEKFFFLTRDTNGVDDIDFMMKALKLDK